MYAIAGIGSRSTEPLILAEMEKIGIWCKQTNITVRSGHAAGADYAFELGSQSKCVAYLPWPGFNANLVSDAELVVYKPDFASVALAAKYHPAYDRLTQGAKKLMGRSGWQVLGPDMKNKVNAVVCWTEDYQKPSGGTSHAIRIANAYGIPVINMSDPNFQTAEDVIVVLKTILGL